MAIAICRYCKCSIAARRKFKKLLLIILIVFVVISVHLYHDVVPISPLFRGPKVSHLLPELKEKRSVCIFPKLDPFGQDILQDLAKFSKPDCILEANNTVKKLQFVQIKGTRILKRVNSSGGNCCYQPFHWVDDMTYEFRGQCIPIIETETELAIQDEFIEIRCFGGDGEIIYKDAFAFVSKKPEVEKRIEKNLERDSVDDRLSVSILVLDSTSHMNFVRMMPKSNAFLLQNMSAVVLQGYTKTGQNTLPNMVPLLAGMTIKELKWECSWRLKLWDIRLDDCPLIWKSFRERGYRTAFADDDYAFSLFHVDWLWRKSFSTPPTDYYFRSFAKLMEKTQRSGGSEKLCYGTRLSFQILLDNMENMAKVYKNDPYFQLTISTHLTHNNINALDLGDEPLYNFLTRAHSAGHFKNTALIVMGDHGMRMGYRSATVTTQGNVEDRMPMFYLMLPPTFQQIYPVAYSNLLRNRDRLTSHFDVHETLKDFMNLTRLKEPLEELPPPSKCSRRPSSLFRPIPFDRTCLEAGVSLHWCVCSDTRDPHRLTEIPSRLVKSSVEYSIETINEFISGQPCAQFTFVRIIDVFPLPVGDELKCFHESSWGSGGNYFDNGSSNETLLFRVTFEVTPGEVLFLATVLKTPDGRLTLVYPVARLNLNNEQSKCVFLFFKYKGYCVCI